MFRSIPLYVNPSVVHAADWVAVLLKDYDYSPHARDRVVLWTIRHGTPAGCPELDREDEADACMTFEESLPAVPYDDPAWDREDVVLDARMLAEGRHPWPLVGSPDDFDAAMADFEEQMPPPRFTPSPEDWRSYREHFDSVEPRYGYE